MLSSRHNRQARSLKFVLRKVPPCFPGFQASDASAAFFVLFCGTEVGSGQVGEVHSPMAGRMLAACWAVLCLSAR